MPWAVKRFDIHETQDDKYGLDKCIQNWLEEVAPHARPEDIKVEMISLRETRHIGSCRETVHRTAAIFIFVKKPEAEYLPTIEEFGVPGRRTIS